MALEYGDLVEVEVAGGSCVISEGRVGCGCENVDGWKDVNGYVAALKKIKIMIGFQVMVE